MTQTALLVLGMHRSGTSATAGVLARLGVDFGRQLMPATPDNPGGYFEHTGVVALHDELFAAFDRSWFDPRPLPDGWLDDARGGAIRQQIRRLIERDFKAAPLWGLKDPRLCRVLPLWLPMLAEMGVRVGCVHVLRHPGAVGASLHSRDGFGFDHAGLLWLRHVLETETATRGAARIRIDYADVMQDWAGTMARVALALDLTWPVPADSAREAVGAFISGDHRHHREPVLDGYGPAIADGLRRTHKVLAGGDEDAVAAVLDGIAREVDEHDGRALSIYGTVLGEYVRRLGRRNDEVRRMRGSFSWKAVRPLRALERAITGRKI